MLSLAQDMLWGHVDCFREKSELDRVGGGGGLRLLTVLGPPD